MPIRNASAFLKECLDSIIKQDYQNWELIAVNDNSTDNTQAILNEYQNLDNRILLIDNDKVGIIPALKIGYKQAKGMYITRMDADDVMSLDKISSLKKLLDDNGQGYVSSGLVKYFSKSDLGNGYLKYEEWLNNLCIANSNFNSIYKECSIPSPCWMIHRNDFDKCGGFENEVYPEDYDLAFRFYKNKMKVIGSNRILHYWRDSSTRASRNDDNYRDNRFLQLKTDYFIEIDYLPNRKLVLWGAGKKGKEIAKILIEKGIDFEWICNTPNKIGRSIYNKEMKDCEHIDLQSTQIIIAVANENDQLEIENKIKGKGSINYFYFC